jgi:hypothetical protein
MYTLNLRLAFFAVVSNKDCRMSVDSLPNLDELIISVKQNLIDPQAKSKLENVFKQIRKRLPTDSKTGARNRNPLQEPEQSAQFPNNLFRMTEDTEHLYMRNPVTHRWNQFGCSATKKPKHHVPSIDAKKCWAHLEQLVYRPGKVIFAKTANGKTNYFSIQRKRVGEDVKYQWKQRRVKENPTYHHSYPPKKQADGARTQRASRRAAQREAAQQQQQAAQQQQQQAAQQQQQQAAQQQQQQAAQQQQQQAAQHSDEQGKNVVNIVSDDEDDDNDDDDDDDDVQVVGEGNNYQISGHSEPTRTPQQTQLLVYNVKGDGNCFWRSLAYLLPTASCALPDDDDVIEINNNLRSDSSMITAGDNNKTVLLYSSMRQAHTLNETDWNCLNEKTVLTDNVIFGLTYLASRLREVSPMLRNVNASEIPAFVKRLPKVIIPNTNILQVVQGSGYLRPANWSAVQKKDFKLRLEKGQFWGKKSGVDITDRNVCDIVMLPCNVGHHWVLAVADLRCRTIKIYNSAKKNLDYGVLELLHEALKWMYDKKEKTCPNFEFQRPENIPKQTNEYDCGLFVFQFAQCIALDIPIEDNETLNHKWNTIILRNQAISVLQQMKVDWVLSRYNETAWRNVRKFVLCWVAESNKKIKFYSQQLQNDLQSENQVDFVDYFKQTGRYSETSLLMASAIALKLNLVIWSRYGTPNQPKTIALVEKFMYAGHQDSKTQVIIDVDYTGSAGSHFLAVVSDDEFATQSLYKTQSDDWKEVSLSSDTTARRKQLLKINGKEDTPPPSLDTMLQDVDKEKEKQLAMRKRIQKEKLKEFKNSLFIRKSLTDGTPLTYKEFWDEET